MDLPRLVEIFVGSTNLMSDAILLESTKFGEWITLFLMITV